MRAFVDFFIDKMNETANFNSKVVLVQPIPKFTTPDVGDFINEQEGLYTLYLRGSENGPGSLFQTGNLLYQPLLKCIQRL